MKKNFVCANCKAKFCTVKAAITHWHKHTWGGIIHLRMPKQNKLGTMWMVGKKSVKKEK